MTITDNVIYDGDTQVGTIKYDNGVNWWYLNKKDNTVHANFVTDDYFSAPEKKNDELLYMVSRDYDGYCRG